VSDVCEWCGAGERDSECYLCALRKRSERTEAETVKRIVAWLRAEALKPERYRDAEAWALAADAIERGDYK